MTKKINFQEAKQLKERGFTVKQALDSAKDADDVIVTFIKDGEIHTAYSSGDGNFPKLIGMLELSKTMLIEQ